MSTDTSSPTDRPEIRIGSSPDTIRVLKTTIRTGTLPGTYVDNGTLVQVETVSGGLVMAADDDAPLPVAATRLTPASLAGLLADHAQVVRTKTRKKPDGGLEFFDEEVTPPRDVLASVLATKTWKGLRPLRGIIGAPVLRPDGTLLQQPGYDEATGFYLASSFDLPVVPDQPTTEQVRAARRFLLRDVLGDFPWSSQADRANYLALLVTPVLRHYTRSLTPFALIDATMPASGKTILTAGPGMLYGQRVLTWPDAEEELRKSITAVFCDQVGCVVFDNLAEGTVIDSAVLAQLVTGKTWADRQLGSSRTLSAVNDRLWMATGNNLQVGGDMASRTVRVHLDPNMPKPENRDQSTFGIPHLDQWITVPAHQMTVMWHLLILVLDWIHAGAPRDRDLTMRQFTPWAHALGGFLAHHRVAGFLTNQATVTDIDEDAIRWRAFLTCWHTRHGSRRVTAAELRRDADSDRLGDDNDPWEGTFITTSTGRIPNAMSLGRLLTGQTGRWRGEHVIRSGDSERGDRRVFWVEHHPQ